MKLSHTSSSIVVTGDRPTGKLHLGHYVGSLKKRLELQTDHEMFIIIADTQVLNNDVSKAKNVKFNILQVMRDYLAVGLDPEKVHFFLQSEISELFELTNYLSNIVTLPQVSRIPTIKSENEIYNSALNMGFLNYPVSQAADVLLLNGEFVPVGEDQLPILEFANDIRERFHHVFSCDIFPKINPLLSDNARLCGLDGKHKMSKSLNNAIFLSDEDKDIELKVKQMYTDSNHLKINDPGQIEGNVVFEFLDCFHSNQQKIDELKSHYQQGGLGDMYLKKMLTKDLIDFITPIREKRNLYDDKQLLDILEQGNTYVKAKAKAKMQIIKNIIFQ